ncbi:4428_t:CDS:2 [Dentiscutata erythropus]|uniref:4428_t:CDS:1 n=1 Tax=Dentiscutata erythropus TaxID=1348616 RepID=A0A9N9IJF5_9GLOM|nr:4428_t:CDS:2 [Dentiscutata erythropus]
MYQLTQQTLEEHLNSFGDLIALKKKFISDYVNEQQRQAFDMTDGKDLNSTNNKPKAKRRKKTKSLLASSQIMQNFSSRKVGTKRVTLRSDSKPGIFNKGKASEKVSTKGVPDLVFSEVDFLYSGSSKKRGPSKLSSEAPSLHSDSNDHSYNGVQSTKSPYFVTNLSDDGVQSTKYPYFATNLSDNGLQKNSSQDCNSCNQHQDTQKHTIQDKDDDDKTISSIEDALNSLHSNTGPADEHSCTYRPSGISIDIKDVSETPKISNQPNNSLHSNTSPAHEHSCTYQPSGTSNDIKDDSELNETPKISNRPNDYYKFSMSDANKKYSSISQAVSSYCASQKPSVTTIGVPSDAVKWLLIEQGTTLDDSTNNKPTHQKMWTSESPLKSKILQSPNGSARAMDFLNATDLNCSLMSSPNRYSSLPLNDHIFSPSETSALYLNDDALTQNGIDITADKTYWQTDEEYNRHPNYYASSYTDLHNNEDIIKKDTAIDFREIDLSDLFIWRKHKLH